MQRVLIHIHVAEVGDELDQKSGSSFLAIGVAKN